MTSLKILVVFFAYSFFLPSLVSFLLFFPSPSSFVIGSHVVYAVLELSVAKDYFEFFNSLNYI